MSIRDKNDGFSQIPPRDGLTDNRYAWQSGVTGAAAVSLDIWAPYAAGELPKGRIWMEFEATTTVARFRLSRTATTATTIANGTTVNVQAGFNKLLCMVDPRIDRFIDVIATGAGTFKWRMASAEIIREYV